LAFSN